MRQAVLISVVLVFATLAAYWSVRHAGFVNYDDPIYVSNNPDVSHGLTWHGVVWAFTGVHANNWHPLTWLSHMADCSLFGKNPGGSHLVNLGFHLANTLLLLLLLWRMTGAVWRSAFVAALFALHPLHVESVAWISERKDVLSTFFGLLTLVAYVSYVRESKVQSPKSKVWYLLAVVCFVLGLLSKPMLVTLPFVMLLLDYWPLQRFPVGTRGPRLKTQDSRPGTSDSRLKTFLSLVREKLPFLALSAASCVVTFWVQDTSGAVRTMQNIALPSRLANAVVGYMTYLVNAFWPAKLAAFYPFVFHLPAVKVALAVMCLLGATVLSLVAARRAPYLLVGWLWFLGTLIPVIGLVQVGAQAMADRYTYIPLIGVFVMLTWGAVDLTTWWRWQRPALAVVAAMVLSGCFLCTRLQAGYWGDSLALFSHAIEVTNGNAVAEEGLGYTLAARGNEREAIRHFDASVRLWPDYLPARLGRAIALMLEGRVDDAIADYREVIRLRPSSAKAYYQLADALAQQRKLAEAKTNYLLALRYQPNLAEAHTKLGKLLLLQGDPTNAMAHLYEAVRIRPDYPECQYALGNELAQQRKFSEAIIHLRAAIKAQPKCIPALNDLAWILATQHDPAIRDVPEAIRLASRACELTRDKDGSLLATLGVAQSEAGQFSEAIRSTEQARALAAAAHDEQTAAGLRRRLEFYRKGQAYSSIPR